MEWISVEKEMPPCKPVLMCWRPVDHKERPFHRELIIGRMAHNSNTEVWANGRYYDIKTHITEWAAVELPIKQVKTTGEAKVKYIKKPVAIEAMQLLDNEASIRAILIYMGQTVTLDCDMARDRFSDYCNGIISDGGLRLKTLESDNETQVASIGDFIIKGVRGEFYPIKPDIFKETYCTEEEYANL